MHGTRTQADRLDRDRHLIAGPEPAGRFHRKDHVAGVAVLHPLTVEHGADRQGIGIVQLSGVNDHRPERCEGVEALAEAPLAAAAFGALLPVAVAADGGPWGGGATAHQRDPLDRGAGGLAAVAATMVR